MTDDFRPIRYVPIKLKDGKSHTIYFNNEAFDKLEEALDVSFMDFLKVFGMTRDSATQAAAGKVDLYAMAASIRLSKLKVVLWAGLLHKEPDLTITEARELINTEPDATFGTVPEVYAAAVSAYAAAIGIKDTTGTDDDGETKNSKGPELTTGSGAEESSSPESTS